MESSPKTLAKKVGTPESVILTVSWSDWVAPVGSVGVTTTPLVKPLSAAVVIATDVALATLGI